jgi:hypothetical protein
VSLLTARRKRESWSLAVPRLPTEHENGALASRLLRSLYATVVIFSVFSWDDSLCVVMRLRVDFRAVRYEPTS